MSYQKAFILALLISAVVTMLVGLPRWLCRKIYWIGVKCRF